MPIFAMNTDSDYIDSITTVGSLAQNYPEKRFYDRRTGQEAVTFSTDGEGRPQFLGGRPTKVVDYAEITPRSFSARYTVRIGICDPEDEWQLERPVDVDTLSAAHEVLLGSIRTIEQLPSVDVIGDETVHRCTAVVEAIDDGRLDG